MKSLALSLTAFFFSVLLLGFAIVRNLPANKESSVCKDCVKMKHHNLENWKKDFKFKKFIDAHGNKYYEEE